MVNSYQWLLIHVLFTKLGHGRVITYEPLFGVDVITHALTKYWITWSLSMKLRARVCVRVEGMGFCLWITLSLTLILLRVHVTYVTCSPLISLAWKTWLDMHDDDIIKWKHFPRYWPLWGESTSDRWTPLTEASDAELWCFLWSAPAQTNEHTIETPVIWDAIALILTPQ